MSVPAYPDYKVSGVPWLGAVPAHWEVAALKRQVRLVTQRAVQRTFSVALENIEGWTGRFLATDTEFEGDGVAFEEGDILYGKLRPYLAKILVPNSAGEAIGDFHVLRPLEQNPFYLSYLLRTKELVSVVDGSTYGSKMPRASWDFLGSLTAAFPPIAEQNAITTFLDCETAKIDRLVAEQERLIALLKEKRQAVISHAVTKGLNPNAPMKDSGIEWLGEIPVHWDVTRLRQIATLNPSKSEIADWDAETEISFLPMEAIGEDGALSLERTRPIAETQTGYTYFREGDVTIAKITPCFENGKGAIMRGLVQGIGFGTTELIVIRPSQEATTSEYLDWTFRSDAFRALGEGSMYGAGGQKRVPDDFVRNFPICLPSLEEQGRIVDYLDRVALRFNSLSAQAQSAITLLQERRAALISAAVTGKIDVRGLVDAGTELEVART